jgi:transcriptional regulator with XRE-family HTH domain
MGKERVEDPCMKKAHKAYRDSGLSMHEIGIKMGYSPASARQAVSQFLKSGDPQVSILRRFAKAVGAKVDKLL